MDANEFRRLIVNLIRKGSVVDVNLASNPPTCRVSVGDPDDENNPGLTTNWLPMGAQRAGTTREWNPLTKGEQVLLVCPMGDPAQGVILCSINSDAAPAPSHSADKHHRLYPDGAIVEYDHAQHALAVTLPDGATVTIISPGSVTVKTETALVQAESITLDAPQTTCTGKLRVQDLLTFENGITGKGGKGGAAMKIDGSAAFTGDVEAEGISTAHHTHREQGDGALVSAPQ